LIPSAQLIQYIEEVDKNGDGEIDFEEFQAMMAKV
jgi:Ca2+-binding EF-hand superfamily protein